jgi:hypothetical protein
MRYIIETTEEGNEQSVWNTINSLVEKKLISVVEKGDPIENMKENLRRITRAVQMLEKVGLGKDVMEAFLCNKTKLGKGTVRKILNAQSDFFEKVGVELK